MKDKKQMQVSAIENGTVIDHIPARNLFKVVSILGLNHLEQPVTFGTNMESSKLGRKAIVKISDVILDNDEINKIALVAPQAKINIIHDYEVKEKKIVKVPETIIGIARCFNPQCITNHENVTTRFKVIEKKDVSLKCLYCEKITEQDEIEII